jgi:hypothetical protein
MKVFISYSLNDAQQYVLSILAKRLKEQGHIVSTGYSVASLGQNNHNLSQINNSNLFIGLITAFGNANDNVIKEWQHARAKKIPTLLLIENIVPVAQEYSNDPNIIRFNRNNPEPSIDLVRNRIEASRSSQETNNDGAWLIGGLAILALIGLLSKEK